MSTVNLRAAPAARESCKLPRTMATPRKAMRYKSDTGEWEVIRPHRDLLVTDHEVVLANPEAFVTVPNELHPRVREHRRLEAELADIDGKLASMPPANPPRRGQRVGRSATRTTDSVSGPGREPARWRLPTAPRTSGTSAQDREAPERRELDELERLINTLALAAAQQGLDIKQA
jgi:hypothetical protein